MMVARKVFNLYPMPIEVNSFLETPGIPCFLFVGSCKNGFYLLCDSGNRGGSVLKDEGGEAQSKIEANAGWGRKKGGCFKTSAVLHLGDHSRGAPFRRRLRRRLLLSGQGPAQNFHAEGLSSPHHHHGFF